MDAKVDVSHVVLETERLLLRPFGQEDLQDFYEYASVEGVGEMAGWAHHKSVEESQAILKLFMEEKKTFALVYKETGKVIGSLGLESSEREELEEGLKSARGREIGYVLSKDYWGLGLMPEAVKRVIQYAFEQEGYDFLLCAHYDFNDQSRRVIEKCGFQFYQNVVSKTRMGTEEQGKLYVLRKESFMID